MQISCLESSVLAGYTFGIRKGDIIKLDEQGVTRWICLKETSESAGLGVWVENERTKERKWLFERSYRVVNK